MRRLGTTALLVLAVSTASAATVDDPIPGRSVTVRTGRLLKVVAKPPSGLRFALPVPTNAPTVGGATLHLIDTLDAARVQTIALPVQPAPAGWRVLGPVASPTGYRYRGTHATGDPCDVVLKTTGIRIRCRGGGVLLPTPLVGDLGVLVEVGAGPHRYCAQFGGSFVENSPLAFKRKHAPAPSQCPTIPSTTTTTTTSTTTTTTLPDADGDSVPDALDACPGGDDRVDLNRNDHPDACDPLAERSMVDAFESYGSDGALQGAWVTWTDGADVSVVRGMAQGEGHSTSMHLTAVRPDPVTGNHWASVSRSITGPAATAFDGLQLHVRHDGAGSLVLGMHLTESNGEPWAAVLTTVALQPEGGAWAASSTTDANGTITLPPGFHGLVRLPFDRLQRPSWYGGSGNGVLDTPKLSIVSVGFNTLGHIGAALHVDSVAWWYGVDPAIEGRVEARTWPSSYQAWNGIDDEPGIDARTLIARHDLYWTSPATLGAYWSSTTLSEPCTPDPGGSCIGLSVGFIPGSLAGSAAVMADLRARNPNLVLLAEIRYRDAWSTYLPAAHRFWQHDTNGNRIPGWAEGNFYLLDWHRAEYRAVVAAQAAAAVQAGFDGVMLDWWDDTDDDRIDLAQRVRAAIGDRVLIVNSNDRQVPRTAPFINGIYMEGYQSATPSHWQRLADAVAWADTAVRRPRVNPVETWYATSRNDLNRMRATTTMSLTRSNGYALFCDPNDLPAPDHLHTWYPFWDAPLGTPVAAGTSMPDGSWHRPFTGGTAVYNPMGNPTVAVTFPTPRRSAASGLVGTVHSVPGMDGDLFLVP